MAAGILLGLVLAGAYLASAQRSVTSTSTVRLNVISAEPFTTQKSASELIDSQTEVQTATASTVLSAAAKDIGSDRTPQQMRQNTNVTLVQNTAIMKVRYTAGSQSEAERGADAIASQYLTYRGQLADNQIASVVKKITTRRTQLSNDLVAANTQKANARPGSGTEIQAESDAQLISIELNSIANQLNDVEGIDTSGGINLIGAGQTGSSISPSRQLVLGAALGLGLVLGILAAFVVERLDRRLRDRHDVRQAGGGDVLGQLAGSSAALPAQARDLDEIRSLRERLLATLPDNSPVLTVSDLTRGPSDVGPNLAYAFSETGRLVDLVMPGVTPEVLAEVVDGLGLADRGERNGVHWYGAGNLDLLVPAAGSLLVAGDGGLADRFSASAQTDVTVIVLPPKAERSQLLAAARLGHSLILVVSRATRAAEVDRLADELSAVGAVVHGSVLVRRGRAVRSRRKKGAPAPRPDVAEVGRQPVGEDSVDAVDARSEAPQDQPAPRA